MAKEPKIENLKSKLSFGIKFWLKFDGKSIIGKGWAKLLESIDTNKDRSLTQAAKECEYSYKYAWNILKRIEQRTGKAVVITGKGGPGGGGWVKLNEWGRYLLQKYNDYSKELDRIEQNLEETVQTN
ncbi:MAG: ModE family transcriptional regulator [Candidatus Lokiarchaeota archaeon]|nr:ModE family transcriptional regulator [Candidatus Lokiarchaeota archaeon]